MNELINRHLRIPYWVIYLLFIALVIAIALYAYGKIDQHNSKAASLVGGIASGLVVYLVTMATVINPIKRVDHFDKLGVKSLLKNRHDKDYYRKLVSSARANVDVMGASCVRFVNDFLDVDADDKVLVDALRSHQKLRIRLLIPVDAKMSESAKSNFAGMLPTLTKLQSEFGDRVMLKRYDNTPQHSFVRADNNLVAGPIFEGDQSRHAPAVHVTTWSAFGEKYLTYFENQWAAASDHG